jgi:hypothetical protein
LLKITLRKKEKNYSWENKKLNRGLKCKEKGKELETDVRAANFQGIIGAG